MLDNIKFSSGLAKPSYASLVKFRKDGLNSRVNAFAKNIDSDIKCVHINYLE